VVARSPLRWLNYFLVVLFPLGYITVIYYAQRWGWRDHLAKLYDSFIHYAQRRGWRDHLAKLRDSFANMSVATRIRQAAARLWRAGGGGGGPMFQNPRLRYVAPFLAATFVIFHTVYMFYFSAATLPAPEG
jgi:hypothetical protein